MKSRLTITLDKELITKAEDYANKSGRTLSEIVENYLKDILLLGDSNEFEDAEITPFVRSLSVKINFPTDFDYKEELTKILIEKYK